MNIPILLMLYFILSCYHCTTLTTPDQTSIGPITNIDLTGINWVIVGGESGPKARPMKEEWVLKIKEECLKSKVPFFFKQWGGFNKKKSGRLLEGRTWDQYPFEIISDYKNMAE